MIDLLLECARPKPDRTALRLIAGSVSCWDDVLALASYHGLAPLLEWQLAEACPDALPAAVASNLKAALHESAHRNLALSAVLTSAVALLTDANIPVLTVKGPALAWSLYDSPALRMMTDVDLLVHPEDVRKAIEILATIGYEPGFAAAPVAFFHCNRQLVLHGNGRGDIDLHWALATATFDSALDLKRIWANAVQVQVAGGSVPTLAPEDLLIFLCLHGGKHCWRRLSWLADLAWLLYAMPIDWDDVLTLAESRRVSRALNVGLLLTADLLSVDLPATALDSARRDRAACSIVARYTAELRANPASEHLWMPWSLLERRRDRLRFLLGKLEPNTADFQALRLPVCLFPAYYLARPVRVAKRTARAQLLRRSAGPVVESDLTRP